MVAGRFSAWYVASLDQEFLYDRDRSVRFVEKHFRVLCQRPPNMLIHSRAKNPSDLSGLETVLQFVDCRDFELFVDAKNTLGIELWKLQDASQLGRHLRLEGVKLPRRSGFDYLPNH